MKKQKKLWLSIGILVLLVGIIMLIPVIRRTVNSDDYKPIIFDATESPEVILGSDYEYIRMADSSGGEAEAPPEFEFPTSCFVVKAKVAENYTDLYYGMQKSERSRYRMIRMETLEVIHGEDIPKNFLYLIPDSLYVDMSGYDSLLISMSQMGMENYVLKNITQQRVEAVDLPVFHDYQDDPSLGSIIAFTDGVFDESLWHTKSWHFGCQFGLHRLDYPEYSDLVVGRGDSERDVIENIHSEIEEDRAWLGEEYRVPSVLKLEFTTSEAREALEYVAPFKNGVFSQSYAPYHQDGRLLIFTRYINGCETEETVTINLDNEKVTYSEVRYTEEDMKRMENIGMQLALKAEKYSEEIPSPPHMSTEEKKLLNLILTAWYAKADGKVYGVIRTYWIYEDKNDRYTHYYDDSYILYDAANKTARDISPQELIDMFGYRRDVSILDYGESIAIAME